MKTNKPQPNIIPQNEMRVPFHRHTGIDSPVIAYSDIANPPAAVRTYSGHMSRFGVFTLPAGWTGLINAVGNTTITHNLGTADYDVSLTPYFTGNYAYQLYLVATNIFSFYSYTHNAGVFTQSNTGFTFILNIQ